VTTTALLDRAASGVRSDGYRDDGHGRAAYAPSMVLALLVLLGAGGAVVARDSAGVRG